MSFRVKKFAPDAFLPERKSGLAAGYDLRSYEDVVIIPGARRAVSTMISVAVPEGYYGRIAPRSGLAVKKGIDVLAGVVDADYRGEIKLVLVNHGDEVFIIKKGDRVSQIILEKIICPPVEEVKDLDQTERGEGGFGSTGVN